MGQFAHLMENTGVMVFLFDPDDRLRIGNKAFREAMFIGETEQPTWEEFMRRNFHAKRGAKIVSPDFEKWCSSVKSRRGKEPHRTFEIDHCDGRWFSMTESVLDGGWMLCVATEITHLRVSERQLRIDRDDAQKAAQTDELTGISNRRHIMAVFDQMRSGKTASRLVGGFACLLDIDHFKKVNDTYGHQAGDDVLVAFSRCIRGSIRLCDSFGRVGGEEFMVLLATSDESEAVAILNRAFDDVRALRPLLAHPDFCFTLSAGMVRMKASVSTPTLYSQCDAALYMAKDSGRDQIKIFGRG